MTAPLEVTGTAAEAQPEAGVEGAGAIEGRSLWQIAWMRLKRDRVAMTGGVLVLLLVAVAIFGPFLIKMFGHPPTEFHSDVINHDLQIPIGRFGGISKEFPLGVEPVNG